MKYSTRCWLRLISILLLTGHARSSKEKNATVCQQDGHEVNPSTSILANNSKSDSMIASVPLIASVPRPCFIVGDAPLPNATLARVLRSIKCVENQTQSVTRIPELELDGTRYSTIDFQASLRTQSPVRFALEKFATPEDPTKADAKLFLRYWSLYAAMNLGLRSLGGAVPKGLISQLKGPAFFLDFQLARIHQQGELVHKYLTLVLASCVFCTNEDREEVISLAQSSGVNTTIEIQNLRKAAACIHCASNASKSRNMISILDILSKTGLVVAFLQVARHFHLT